MPGYEKAFPMLGPVDLADWTYDERDHLSAILRRHDAVHAVATGRDACALAFPAAIRELVRRFAAQERLSMEELCAIARTLV